MVGCKIIAVDLGGTYLRIAVVKGKKILNYEKVKTPKTKNGLLKLLVELINKRMCKSVKAIGIASPGPLEKGFIKNTLNIPLKNFNLKKFLERKFKKRVEIENDANCVALAEAKLGCKKKNFFILTLGTGIGGGVIVNNELYQGDGLAGELGHVVINGKYLEDLWKEKKKPIRELYKNKEKNKIASVCEYLGMGIASLINALDPEIVILAGGVRENGNKFLNQIRKNTDKYIFLPKKVNIKWTGLKHPGILGASLLVR